MEHLFALILVAFLPFILSTTQIYENEVISGITVSSTSTPAILLYEVNSTTNPTISMTMFPCYGSMNFFVGKNALPKDQQDGGNVCNNIWDGNEDFEKNCDVSSIAVGVKYYQLISGLQNRSLGISAKFDFLVTLTQEEFNNIVPVPGSDGALTLTSSGTTVSLAWQETNNPQDEYTVYGIASNETTDSGYLSYSACGVEEFMKVLDLKQTKNGNQVSVNIDVTTKMIVSVVVKRSGGYKASYNVAQISQGSHILGWSWMYLLLSLVFVVAQTL